MLMQSMLSNRILSFKKFPRVPSLLQHGTFDVMSTHIGCMEGFLSLETQAILLPHETTESV